MKREPNRKANKIRFIELILKMAPKKTTYIFIAILIFVLLFFLAYRLPREREACNGFCGLSALSYNGSGYEIQKVDNFDRWSDNIDFKTADLDGNGAKESYFLRDGKIEIREKGKRVWVSPDDWRVYSFFLADSNHDNKIELNVSVGKKGNYGSSKPFWILENDQSFKNHFFVLGFHKGKIKNIWQSSNLEKPNCDFIFSDIDEDGKQELIVIEGEYGGDCEGKHIAVWKWGSWGFFNEWRSDAGNFSNLKIRRSQYIEKVFFSVP